MNWQDISPWVAPAIILSIAAYFVRFFGKAIADQIPYADDRDWQIEVNGLWFFVDFLLPPGVIAIATLLYFQDAIFNFLNGVTAWLSPLSYHWIDLAIVFIILLYYSVTTSILSEGKYKLTALMPQTAWGGSEMPEERRKRIFERITDINAVILQPSAMALIFIAGIEVLSGRVLWIMLFAIQIFVALIGLAVNYSLMRYRFPVANIHFIDGKPILPGVTLLKVNKDNIRIRDNDRVSIINRDLISELEMVDADQKTEFARPLASVTTWVFWIILVYSFWKHAWFVGLLAGFVAPLIPAAIGVWLLKIPQQIKPVWVKAYEDIKNNKGANFGDGYKSLPLSLKIMIPIWLAGIVPDVIGVWGAWDHNFFQAFLYGIVIHFLISILFQTIIVPQLADLNRRQKLASVEIQIS